MKSSGFVRAARKHGPWAVATSIALWSMWSLRATLLPVAYLNDSSVHEQMVRFATRLIRTGKDPLTSWFPYLGEGSPQFVHYQSLGALVTGLAGVLFGADGAFRWSLFLLLALWPLVIYASAQLLGLSSWTAAGSAALAPFIVSVPSIGYERGAYLWVGFGLWAQLWASWALPLAWAFTWRSMDDRRFLCPAAISVASTIGFHFETGYLALLAIMAFPFVVPSQLAVRLRKAALLLGGSLLASAWVLVPLVVFGKWAAINQVLQGTPLVNGYGARRVLSWLVTGQLYDEGRFPVITLLALIGAAIVIARWRKSALGRAILVMWVLCILLMFGRTTFGALMDVIPGSRDIFFRRFVIGAQLAGLLLAGIGLVEGAKLVATASRWLADRAYDSARQRKIATKVLRGIAVFLTALALAPAVVQADRFDAHNSAAVHAERDGETIEVPQITPLIAFIKSHGGGRTYAGLPANWGSLFTVGAVPVFKYLESADVDEVGYTLRTASLMTDPEYHFDEANPSDYTLFGVRYLLLPSNRIAPVAAREVMRRGPYSLWTIESNGYCDVVETIGTVAANRSDIASRTIRVLRSNLIAHHQDLVVAYAGAGVPVQKSGERLFATPSVQSPGAVISEGAGLANGNARCTIAVRRPSVVMLSASFDPGWRVSVDGQVVKTVMLAPAVVGVRVGPGVHRVLFVHSGFGYYPALALLGVIALVALFVIGQWRTNWSPRSQVPYGADHPVVGDGPRQ
jgi:hypothetical protein